MNVKRCCFIEQLSCLNFKIDKSQSMHKQTKQKITKGCDGCLLAGARLQLVFLGRVIG